MLQEFLNGMDATQLIMGTGAAFSGAIFGFLKIKSAWKKFASNDKKIEVEDNVIETLHKEFVRINEELESARNRQQTLNNLVHDQTLKLNRMEFIMLRMYNLITHNNIEIPADLRDNLENMINGDQ